MSSTRHVAFLGLGQMGLPMARNLAASGRHVICYDPAPDAARDAAEAGLAVGATVAEATTGAGIVITMLPSGRHVIDAYAPGAGIVDTVEPGTLLVDCSTIAIADARDAHRTAGAHGLPSVDAPVSGGVVGADAGTLTFMAGGAPTAVAAAEPVLGAMGKKLIACGGPGMGQAAKACNNMVLACSMIAVSEAFLVAEGIGLDPAVLHDVLTTSSGRCWAAEVNCPVPGPVPSSPANRDFSGGFASRLMVKDLHLADLAAGTGGVDIELGRHALAIYERVSATDPARDFSAVIEHIRQRSAREAT